MLAVDPLVSTLPPPQPPLELQMYALLHLSMYRCTWNSNVGPYDCTAEPSPQILNIDVFKYKYFLNASGHLKTFSEEEFNSICSHHKPHSHNSCRYGFGAW